MKKLLEYLKEDKIILNTGIILLVALIIMINSFKTNYDIYYDDGVQHLLRAYGTYQTIVQNRNASIIANFSNGFGYAWDFFYGSLSTYGIILFSILSGSFNLGFKLVLFLTVFLAGIFMYKFVFELSRNSNTALLASIIYITSPYFFTDIYVRHAIGECLGFVFIPLVFLGLYNLFNTENNHYYLIFGAVGLIISHNISTTLVAFFSLIYVLVNFKNLSSQKVKKGLFIDIIFIIFITSFYWIPLLQTKYFTNYRVYEKDAMVTKESFFDNRLLLSELFIAGNDDELIFEIGFPIIIMLVFSIMAIQLLENNKKEYIFFLVSGLLSLWMSTRYFPWKFMPEFTYIIQFSWRMLFLSTFFFAIVSSMNMSLVIKYFNIKDVLIIMVICLIYIYSRMGAIPYSENVVNVKDYTILNVTGQSDEWLSGMGRLEYLPSKAYNDTFYIATRESGILVLSGECNIDLQFKVGNYMTAKIETGNVETILELPYIYYPGFSVRFDGIIIDTFETDNGFLGCKIAPKDAGNLEIKYTGTKIMNFSKVLSIISFVIFSIYVWKKH